MFYVQHLLGIGHVMRAATLTRAMLRHDLEVCVVHGGMAVPGADFGAARMVKLPPLRASDNRFSGLVDAHGHPPDEQFLANRRACLLRSFRSFAPQLVLIEMFPFGRRQMRFELMPLLNACLARERAPVIVCSLRDIVQRKRKPGRMEEVVGLIEGFFDHVLVHGDPALIALGESFAAAAQIAARIHHTGYVVRRPRAAPPIATGEVLVSAGGGAVGLMLMEVAMAARALTGIATRRWRFLVGAGQSEQALRSFKRWTPSGVTVERSRQDFPELLAGSRLSISQGGYNTVSDILVARVPAVLVPFEGVGETEQLQRARRLAERGIVRLVRERDLDPVQLAVAVDQALTDSPDVAAIPDLRGAETSAALIAGWVSR